MTKPPDVYDRDREWEALDRFVGSDRPGTTLGLVYGRRRQGKTYLLESLVEAAGGTYVAALEQSTTQNLARLADAYRRASGTAGQVVFPTAEAAFAALLSLGEGAASPRLLVVDELPYLLGGFPELPSVLQDLLRPRSGAGVRSRTRLVLCGSALSAMRGLLGGSAPLRGRASLELMVRPFSFRDVAGFWGIDDPAAAVMVHALVGGTPAYRDMCGSAPRTADGVDAWVAGTLLDPSSAMFREGRVLLAEEGSLTDTALYLAVLAAVSAGATRRHEIAAALGRPETALAHPLRVLADAQLVSPLPDALRQRRTTYHLAEPVLRLNRLVVAPHEARLVRHHGPSVWSEVAGTVASRVYGPHFEHLARVWCAEHAAPGTLGGTASRVGPTVVQCREHRAGHELDVVVVESAAQQAERVVALGEVKWRSMPVDATRLARLEHLRALLGAPDAKLLCFSRSGFTRALAAAGARPDVELVDLERLLGGE